MQLDNNLWVLEVAKHLEDLFPGPTRSADAMRFLVVGLSDTRRYRSLEPRAAVELYLHDSA
jgi:hypothetical protein